MTRALATLAGVVAWLVLGALVLAGCGWGPPPPGRFLASLSCGASLYVEDGVDAEGLAEEVEAAVQLALAYWGARPSLLVGWTIYVVAEQFECGDRGRREGCAEQGPQRITITPRWGCRTALLVHEVGHVVLNDPDHTDPRWPAAGLATVCG